MKAKVFITVSVVSAILCIIFVFIRIRGDSSNDYIMITTDFATDLEQIVNQLQTTGFDRSNYECVLAELEPEYEAFLAYCSKRDKSRSSYKALTRCYDNLSSAAFYWDMLLKEAKDPPDGWGIQERRLKEYRSAWDRNWFNAIDCYNEALTNIDSEN